MRILFLAILFFGTSLNAKECETKYSAIILANNKNKIIYENRADKYMYPASLTKVMTLYLVFEALQKRQIYLWQKIPISAHVEEISAINKITTLHLKEGQNIRVKDAIKAVAVKSMNGAAVALSELIAGDEWSFAKKMNEKAQKLGMRHTNFRNSTGLHEDGQYSSAYDLARLLVAVQKKFPQYMDYFSQKTFAYNGQKFITHNHFVLDYKGATGFKTGFTSKAGFNLMATAKRKGRALSGVIIGCETHEIRDFYSQEIFNEAFDFVFRGDLQKQKVKLTSVF